MAKPVDWDVKQQIIEKTCLFIYMYCICIKLLLGDISLNLKEINQIMRKMFSGYLSNTNMQIYTTILYIQI